MVGWGVSMGIYTIDISWYSWCPCSSQLKCFSFRESSATMERRRLWVETAPAVACERQNCWIWVMSTQGCVFNMAQKALSTKMAWNRWIYLPWIAMDPRISVVQMLRCIQRLGRDSATSVTFVWVSQRYLQSYGPGSKGPQNAWL